jgi:hypothetical protein
MRQPLHLITDGSSSLNSSFSQIVSRLKIHPELSRGVEVNGQPDCQIGADPELAFHKLLDLGQFVGMAKSMTVMPNGSMNSLFRTSPG